MKPFLLIAALVLAGCGGPSPSFRTRDPTAINVPIDCGPIQDTASCQTAVAVAATENLNGQPVARATLRRPQAGDPCMANPKHPCGPSDVIVSIQSGDTLQDIAVVPTSSSWALFDAIR
jgi:4'-phosphopantetheinyl transferase EntD